MGAEQRAVQMRQIQSSKNFPNTGEELWEVNERGGVHTTR